MVGMNRGDRVRALEQWADRVDPADLVEADVSVLRSIAELADERMRIEAELLTRVRLARERGRSWAQIGAMLGVSKQAAQRKYASKV
jgi:hypothetical protein